jgi:hypothetical protein
VTEQISKDLYFAVSFPNQLDERLALEAMLDGFIAQGKFNKARAAEMCCMLFERQWIAAYPLNGADALSRFVAAKPIIRSAAEQFADKFVHSRGNVTDQRCARTGLMAKLLGK